MCLRFTLNKACACIVGFVTRRKMIDTVDLQNTYLSTDVVCVKFLGSFVFAGVGGNLKVFSLHTCSCVREVEVFKGHKIYGIQPGDINHILVFGCKSICVFQFSLSKTEVCLMCIAALSVEDWILAAHWLSNGTQVALVTAHNVAWCWKWQENDCSSLKRADCFEKCILYSATVCGESWNNCVVFAGTVFREVVVWLPGGSIQGDQPVLHRLEGHNGVIFSLTWDWQSSSLCTTSDDRSVRLWSVSLPDKSDWKSSTVTCSNVFYGHSARVWRSIIFEDLIVSVGEDCQICMWSMAGKLLQTIERTTSGCQWTLDYSNEHKLLVTGAGDGSIQLLPLTFPISSPSVLHIAYPKDWILDSNCSSIRKLALISTGCIVSVTEDGEVLRVHPHIETSWRLVCKDERFANYCILSVAPDRLRFSLASLRGVIKIYQITETDSECCTAEHQVENGKIWSSLWLSSEEVLVCGDEGRLSVWQISLEPGKSLVCNGRFRLPRSRERWPTCARIVSKDKQKFLLCGDRCGSIHLFRLQKPDQEYLAPDHSLTKLHGKLGSTSIFHSDTQIFSTGRDGILRTLSIDCKSVQLSVLSNDKMVMDWVCDILPVPKSSKHFLIVGFKETKMIIWSTKERRTIFQLDCGGGHRSWDCIMSEARILQIAFVREKNIHYSSAALETLLKPTLQHGISPREMNCASVLLKQPSSLFFGGEDGTIYLCNFSENLCNLVNKKTLTSHISSVRCMCFHENFLFSAGGRAQLKAWLIEVDVDGELACIEMASHMLKGERHPRSPPSIDPEMRYMSLCSIPCSASNNVVQLVSGCSDGALRWLTFDSANRSFLVVGESMFHGKCVLKVLTVRLHDGKEILISTSTDGRIALWNIVTEMFTEPNSAREPIFSDKWHQSGINSIHVTVLPAVEGTILLIATGGDDNSVVLSSLLLKDKVTSLVAKWSSTTAHAAQVTGVWVNQHWLISASIDQRLTVWRWSISDNSILKCDLVHQSISSVPDLQDMQIWLHRNVLYVCVVGKGVQIFKLPINEECN